MSSVITINRHQVRSHPHNSYNVKALLYSGSMPYHNPHPLSLLSLIPHSPLSPLSPLSVIDSSAGGTQIVESIIDPRTSDKQDHLVDEDGVYDHSSQLEEGRLVMWPRLRRRRRRINSGCRDSFRWH
jgi:hypothetical protein